jgi:hypothetical protein
MRSMVNINIWRMLYTYSKLNYDVLRPIGTKEHLEVKGKKAKNKRSPNVRT